MQNPKQTKNKDTSATTSERQSDATSKETLSDLEESEKVPAPRPTRAADVESSLPSPDGVSDEGRKDNDGSGLM